MQLIQQHQQVLILLLIILVIVMMIVLVLLLILQHIHLALFDCIQNHCLLHNYYIHLLLKYFLIIKNKKISKIRKYIKNTFYSISIIAIFGDNDDTVTTNRRTIIVSAIPTNFNYTIKTTIISSTISIITFLITNYIPVTTITYN